MSKYEDIKVSFGKKVKEMLSNKEELIKFIKFYSKFYKYNFVDALCIYVQNENATAVADYKTWQRIKYQVKKGEKGIGLFDDGTFSKLRYVFDVSSTYQQKIKLWEYVEERHKNIVDLDFSKDKFYEKYVFNNIGDEDLKDLIYYMNRIAKNTRLGIQKDSDKLEILATKILHKVKIQDIDIFFDKLCATIKFDLLEIESNIKDYERNLLNISNSNTKTEKEQEKTVPFSVVENKSNEKLKDEEISLFNNNYYNEIKSQEKAENKNTIEKQTEQQQTSYNIGDTIILEEMVGENLPNGLKGVIKSVDDIGQIHIAWENGSSLAIDPKIDKFEIIQKEKIEEISNDEIMLKYINSYIGKEIEFEKQIYTIYSVNNLLKRVNLTLDVNLPVFKDESVETIYHILKNQEEINKSSSFLFSNFNIHNKKTPYPTTTNEKIQANIDAIKTLRLIESEKRVARAEEKEILANYVGFGGLPQVFENIDNIKSPFIKEKAIEIKELLTDKEYEMARASTLNAHYTSKEIIDCIYDAIKNFGYDSNIKILEPSCGIGNFIGNLPENLKNSNITGVELDSITGRIAKQLYPNAKIKINGFEKEYFNKNSFDLVVDNVPFGDYSIYDKEYNKNNYLIHDYFINKSIELTKPNGIVAVITSKGTLDKKDDSFRREISKKAELIGAIRLPNTAFKKLAGTEVTSDILFFQKLEKERQEIPDWVNTTEVKFENRINNYFTNHPEMILGELNYKTNRYGRYDLTVDATNENISEDLKQAIENLPKNIVNNQLLITNDDIINEDNGQSDKDIDYLLNQPNYRIYRYAYYNDKIFYKYSNNHIEQVNVKNKDRVIGMIKIRDLAKEIIDVQLDVYSSDELFNKKLKEFNRIYDEFVAKYGYINSRINISAFKEDDDIHFLTSLEKSVDGKYEKTKFFFQKTIAPNIEIESVDNAKDALVLSLNKYGDIDFEYMQKLYDKQINEIIDELIQVDFIYLNPLNYSKEDITKGWEVKSIYLNGNVKNKLKIVEELEEESPYFQRNIEKLKEVIPKDVDFSDIKIDIGSDLYKPEDMKAFAKKILNLYSEPDIRYNEKTSEWKIYNKTVHNYLATQEYGTNRIGALYIFEKILNNTEVVVKDEVEDSEGRKRYVQNKEETIKATEKKMLIEREFEEFIHQNKEIRDRIMKEYNERFNNSINANFDLELTLPNLSPDIKLRPHQKRAVARSIFNPNNLLLDHQVGAGKTFIMIVSAMENKRLGRANKPLLVVPNNIMGQFKNDFYLLYPNANILYADEKSFETKNRKRFLSKIAQNEYDAVIMGQSQFDLLKISKDRIIENLENEIKNIINEMSELDKNEDRLTIKMLERTRKSLERSLIKLIHSKEETILDFEQLGIDALYIDEAHLYKNLYFITKLRNIAGINQTASKKALNLKMKIDYIEEIGGKVTFATGTPISNTMAEMYTMQRYLMQDTLREQGIYNFDSWQKIFASTETKLEISPAGNGFQLKTRFSNFRNIPELMNLYNKVADVVTTEMINLPVPKHIKEVLEAEASEELEKEMKSFGERAEFCKNGKDPREDNLLKIVNEGRYAGLDIRHIDENNPDYEDSKVNLVVDKVYEIYNQTMENKSTQVIFSDLSTPKENEFNVYDDIKNKLIEKGIKEDEIAFVHSAKTSKQREDMFEKVRIGDIRVILGSTAKMGAGTNFQNKLVALYHLDTPWRPSDLEQREGRILRQGNENEEVKIFKCITKGSFDAYSWQILEQKQRFITQAKVGAITGREVKDIDDITLDYAEIKALATGNPKIKRKMEIDTEIEKLRVLEKAYRKKQYSSENFLNEIYPKELERLNNRIEKLKLDDEYIKTLGDLSSDENFEITIKGNKYTDKEKAGAFLIQVTNASGFGDLIGEYKGFKIYSARVQVLADIKLKHNASHRLTLNNGYKKANIDLLDECILSIDKRIEIADKNIKELQEQKEQVEKFHNTPFEHKETLESLLKEKIEIEREFDEQSKGVVYDEDELEQTGKIEVVEEYEMEM
ncbi:DUF4314 domain-containing protein [[Clostridium] colinum]|uniref:DUF4314 domain-containing protein n=1 Tax=[Clostridium] colinum TaxID=36835 RepID=UPI0020254530|nr:DUF4314 domain-containing protein [[Clostridium] colinum]